MTRPRVLAFAVQSFRTLLLPSLVISFFISSVFSPLFAATPVSEPTPVSASPGVRRVEVSADFTAVLSEGAITVEMRALEGEGAKEFARRVAKDEATSRTILALPLSPGRSTVLPYSLISDSLKLAAIHALFPSDLRATAGWLHIAVGEERLAAIVDWFAGSSAQIPAIAQTNGISADIVPRGTTVRIPTEYLLPPFRDAEAIGDEEPLQLEFGKDAHGRFATYRLRRKEALYSAVVVRFTGRLHAEDVVQLALKIAERSGIEDVHAIPVGFPIKIPFEYLSAEFLPKEDPRAQELVREKAETSQFAAPARARGLEGIRVVIDAGHGGRDTGTLHEGIWEATYVYDVACRLRKILAGTRSEVIMTTRESGGWQTPDTDKLVNHKSRLVLTTPPYELADPVVGVNLRWYLANSVLKRPGADRKKIAPEKTVFISLHADSLHPSVRGAMAYVPGERFLRDQYGKSGSFYRNFTEYRDDPVVSFSKKERLVSEGVSTGLAEKLLGAMRAAGLPIHRFSPVRTHVIRGGREWVPAVLRYNRIPNRVLLEIANLGNEEDRALMVTRRFRQSVAESIAAGLLEFFGAPARSNDPAPPIVAASKPERPEPTEAVENLPVTPATAEIYGPWPEIYGPSPPPLPKEQTVAPHRKKTKAHGRRVSKRRAPGTRR